MTVQKPGWQYRSFGGSTEAWVAVQKLWWLYRCLDGSTEAWMAVQKLRWQYILDGNTEA